MFELTREHDHDANPINELLIKHLREVEESRRHFSPLKSPRTPRDDVLDIGSDGMLSDNDDRNHVSAPPTRGASAKGAKIKQQSRYNSPTHDRLQPMKPISKIMNEVVFAVSGFPATLRDNIRKKVMSMGGTYRHKWDSGCTHLICNSSGAAKYALAAGGREGGASVSIVTKEWVESSHTDKRVYPCPMFSLENETTSDTSYPARFSRACGNTLDEAFVQLSLESDSTPELA